MTTVLVNYERISLFHTMAPFFLANKEKPAFRFVQSPAWCLKHDKNKVLFMERMFQSREPRDLTQEEIELMQRLRDKYQAIYFFCGQPEAGNNRLDILPYVDRLFYKSVFVERENYRKPLYGKNLFADYYHKNYNIIDNPEYVMHDEISGDAAQRPLLSWNIGVGAYPRRNFPQRAGAVLARAGFPEMGRSIGTSGAWKKPPPDFSAERRTIAVHARIDPVTVPSIAHQRRLFIGIISNFPEKERRLFVSGMAPQAQYYRELPDSKIVLSPFGWGEVCFRDFEAILAGALLFKPDMAHLKTWPDVYKPYETYIPLAWDGSDLLEKAHSYLANESERRRIAENAYHHYINELGNLMNRFYSLAGDVL